MKNKLLILSTLLLASQSQAAVDVSGFTIEGATRPYGLIAMTVIMVAIGLLSLRRAR